MTKIDSKIKQGIVMTPPYDGRGQSSTRSNPGDTDSLNLNFMNVG